MHFSRSTSQTEEESEDYGIFARAPALWRGEFLTCPNGEGWLDWRRAKLEDAERFLARAPVRIADSRRLSPPEKSALRAQLALANMALYQWDEQPEGAEALDHRLLAFAAEFGLRVVEDHRSANRNGVVRIEVARGARGFYIPYTDRPIAWHTDGYYNYHGPARSVQAMILHCAAAADQGGENRVLDPEIAFLRMAGRDPEALRLLIHPEAMTIPEATDDEGRFRAENRGPVFFLSASGALSMRYTARKKYVSWRDPATSAAAAALLSLIESEPLARREKLRPGQGLLCNNVLHDRAPFHDGAQPRLFCRIRFHNRIEPEA